MTTYSEHHWVVTAAITLDYISPHPVPLEVQIIVSGEDVMGAGRNALSLLVQLGVPEDAAKFTHITPHYFTDADSGGSR
jgi:hypothetical protein